jgi:hypothetical protein
MSSGEGSISRNDRGDFEVYGASKSALNQLMCSYAARRRGEHPGRHSMSVLVTATFAYVIHDGSRFESFFVK